MNHHLRHKLGVACMAAALFAATSAGAQHIPRPGRSLALPPHRRYPLHRTSGARSDRSHGLEGGERGIWRREGSAVRMIYTDGWDDLVSIGADGVFAKRGWSPDADRCGPASNQTKAERLSNDPGPPL